MGPLGLVLATMVLVAGVGTAIRLATGQYYFSQTVTRREKNGHHLATLVVLLITLAVAWGLAHFGVMETHYGYAVAAMMSGVVLLRTVFTEMGLRRREAA